MVDQYERLGASQVTMFMIEGEANSFIAIFDKPQEAIAVETLEIGDRFYFKVQDSKKIESGETFAKKKQTHGLSPSKIPSLSQAFKSAGLQLVFGEPKKSRMHCS